MKAAESKGKSSGSFGFLWAAVQAQFKDVAHTRYAGNRIRDDSEGSLSAGLPAFFDGDL